MAGCWTKFKAEWALEKADFGEFNEGSWIEVFGASSNRYLKDPRRYMAFKLFEALLVTAIFLWSFIDNAMYQHKGEDGVVVETYCGYKYWIYLTHWSLTLQLLFVWNSLWSVWAAHRASKSPTDKFPAPCHAKLTWILNDVLLPLTFLVFVQYWLLVWNGFDGDIAYAILSCCTHGGNFLVMLLDNWLSRIPYYITHGLYFWLVGVMFLLFSFLHGFVGTNCSGQPYIYAALDWNNLQQTLTIAGIICFVVAPIFNLLFWGVKAVLFPAVRKARGTDVSAHKARDVQMTA